MLDYLFISNTPTLNSNQVLKTLLQQNAGLNYAALQKFYQHVHHLFNIDININADIKQSNQATNSQNPEKCLCLLPKTIALNFSDSLWQYPLLYLAHSILDLTQLNTKVDMYINPQPTLNSKHLIYSPIHIIICDEQTIDITIDYLNTWQQHYSATCILSMLAVDTIEPMFELLKLNCKVWLDLIDQQTHGIQCGRQRYKTIKALSQKYAESKIHVEHVDYMNLI